MRFPLLPALVIGYVAGVLLHDLLPAAPALLLLAATGCLLLSLVSRLALPLVSFSLLGFALASLADARLDRSALSALAEERPAVVKLVGTVAGTPAGPEGRRHFVLAVSRMDFPRSLLLSEKVRVEGAEGRLDLGMRVAVEGLLRLPEGRQGFGFDMARHLRNEGIATILRASDIDMLPARPGIALAVSGLRTFTKATVSRTLSGDQAGLMLGILIGDISALSEQLVEEFRETGLTHIVAVSGMNVGLLAVIVLFFLARLPMGRFSRAFALAGVLVFYAALTGGQSPVIRATVMALVGLLAWTILRRYDLFSSLGAAALALLVYNPFLIYDIGFQLSFAATIGILAGVRILPERWPFFGTKVGTALAVALAAQIAVTPILAYHFNQFSVVSILANLASVPAVGPILALGVAGTAVGWALPWLADFLNWLAGWLLAWVIGCARTFASVSWASLAVPSPSLLSIAAYYLILGWIVFAVAHKGRKRFAEIGLVTASLVALTLWGQVIRGLPPSELEVRFFDVGQGDSALIRSPSGAAVLVDTGPDEGRALELLSREGVSRLDLVIISHPQKDHAGGLPVLLRRYPVGRMIWSPEGVEGPLTKELEKLAKDRHIAVSDASPGDQWLVGEDLGITILAPDEEQVFEENDRSVVARADYGDTSFLFTGDIEASGEQALLGLTTGELASTVLKVPHHGAKGSVDEDFLELVRPRIAVISVGEGNSYGHPSRRALIELEKLGSAVYRTDRDGTVTVSSDGRKVRVSRTGS